MHICVILFNGQNKLVFHVCVYVYFIYILKDNIAEDTTLRTNMESIQETGTFEQFKDVNAKYKTWEPLNITNMKCFKTLANTQKDWADVDTTT